MAQIINNHSSLTFRTQDFLEHYISIWVDHGLSQQGAWVPFWTPKPLKRAPQDTQIILCGISKNPNLKHIIEFFHLLTIPMTLFNDRP